MLNELQSQLFIASLYSGQYNLLLGSGISLDSFNNVGEKLISSKELKNQLCKLKGVEESNTLARVTGLLSPDEVEKYITNQFSYCKAGETVSRITNFIWKNIFTFNVDDALEAAYVKNAHRKQQIESINYDEVYKTQNNKAVVSIVHLHGYARQPEKNYVFSALDYAKVTRGLNPWMHVLSELMTTEPFIISGTSEYSHQISHPFAFKKATQLH